MTADSLLPRDAGFDIRALKVPVLLYRSRGFYAIRYEDKAGEEKVTQGTAEEMSLVLRAAGFRVSIRD